MKHLTPAEEIILREFQEREIFSDRDVSAVSRRVGFRLTARLTPLKRDGLLEFLGSPRRWLDPHTEVTTIPVRLYRVTAKGRRALRDGGLP